MQPQRWHRGSKETPGAARCRAHVLDCAVCAHCHPAARVRRLRHSVRALRAAPSPWPRNADMLKLNAPHLPCCRAQSHFASSAASTLRASQMTLPPLHGAAADSASSGYTSAYILHIVLCFRAYTEHKAAFAVLGAVTRKQRVYIELRLHVSIEPQITVSLCGQRASGRRRNDLLLTVDCRCTARPQPCPGRAPRCARAAHLPRPPAGTCVRPAFIKCKSLYSGRTADPQRQVCRPLALKPRQPTAAAAHACAWHGHCCNGFPAMLMAACSLSGCRTPSFGPGPVQSCARFFSANPGFQPIG